MIKSILRPSIIRLIKYNKLVKKMKKRKKYKNIFFNHFYPLLLKCLSISFDKDQLSIILIVTIIPSVINPFNPGNKIVFIISLPTLKSNTIPISTSVLNNLS